MLEEVSFVADETHNAGPPQLIGGGPLKQVGVGVNTDLTLDNLVGHLRNAAR